MDIAYRNSGESSYSESKAVEDGEFYRQIRLM